MMFRGVRHFARYMLSDNRLRLEPLLPMRTYGRCVESVLFRLDCWQVELVAGPSNVAIPRHRHNRVDSMDVVISGWVDGLVGKKRTCEARGPLLANLIRVPKGVWHEGHAGPDGAVYLSFQKWDGVVGFISDDWENP